MNRCIFVNNKNKQCRAKLKNKLFFCCSSHKPLNEEFIIEGCFICMEKVEENRDILFLKCKHVFHKSCFNEWSTCFSTYEEHICLICRDPFLKKNINTKKSKIKLINNFDLDNLKKISYLLDIQIVSI